nr:cytochrome c [Acanthopleuribacter pedis]
MVRIAVPAIIGALLAACSPPEAPPTSVDPLVLGRTIYIKRCVSCHNHDGTGTLRRKPYAADFNQPGGVLSRSDDELLASVLDGKTGAYGTMPAFRPILKEHEVRAALTYIRSQFKPKQAELKPIPGGETL